MVVIFESLTAWTLSNNWTLRNNGENMDSCETSQAIDTHPIKTRRSVESSLEAEDRLNSLRLLVCDLLKTNQELRHALAEARSGLPNNRGS
jgi:hypothetical protein